MLGKRMTQNAGGEGVRLEEPSPAFAGRSALINFDPIPAIHTLLLAARNLPPIHVGELTAESRSTASSAPLSSVGDSQSVNRVYLRNP